MAEKVKIISLGGLDESGKNCLVIDINDDLFVVNCGVGFPDRSMPGIDYVIPNYDFLVQNKFRIRGYFLLHGHDDEMGALAYFYDLAPAPVFGSKVTLQMFQMFLKHVDKDPSKFMFNIIEPTSEIKVGGRPIHFFQTAHNVAESSGICFETELGNIVIPGDFVVENAAKKGFLHDMNAIANIAKKPTLALLVESVYASRAGYTAPDYKLNPHIESKFKDAKGRIFISLYSTNCYNLDELFALAVQTRKKIICYDEETANLVSTLQSCGQLILPRDNMAPFDDIVRLRDQDVIVLICGFGTRLFKKVHQLASGDSLDRRLRLKETDLFVVASPSNDNTEIEATRSIDEIYRTGCEVLNIKRKQFLNMHASEEDIKMMISILKPKYYLPVKGFFKDLLHNGMLALSMGIGLTHNNVFILENGQTLVIDSAGPKIIDENIPHGDILIDATGLGVQADKSSVLADRAKLAEGVIILGCVVDKKLKTIIAGPDCQVRGFSFYGESDSVLREVVKVFVATVQEFLAKPIWNLEEVYQNVYERCLKTVRKQSGREPMIIPTILER